MMDKLLKLKAFWKVRLWVVSGFDDWHGAGVVSRSSKFGA